MPVFIEELQLGVQNPSDARRKCRQHGERSVAPDRDCLFFLMYLNLSDSAYHFIIFKQSFFNKTGDIVRTLLQWLSRMFLDSSRGEFKTVAACECLTRDIRSSTRDSRLFMSLSASPPHASVPVRTCHFPYRRSMPVPAHHAPDTIRRIVRKASSVPLWNSRNSARSRELLKLRMQRVLLVRSPELVARYCLACFSFD